MNLSLAEALVAARCADAGVIYNSIETLPNGGTRLVCRTIEGADEMRTRFKGHVLEGLVKRFPFSVPPSRM
jgi:hypothetical protein